jgi:hypothetical protein
MFLLTVQVNLLGLRLCYTKRRDYIISRPVSTLFYKTTAQDPMSLIFVTGIYHPSRLPPDDNSLVQMNLDNLVAQPASEFDKM